MGSGCSPRLAGLLVIKLIVCPASLGCSAGTWSSASPRSVARHGLSRPLRLARLLDMDLVVCFSSRGCLVGTWSFAPPRRVCSAETCSAGTCSSAPSRGVLTRDLVVHSVSQSSSAGRDLVVHSVSPGLLSRDLVFLWV
jgi:hypothetical protein